MSVLFTETYPLIRATAGAHVKGKYVPGTPTNTTIVANWQPLSGAELLNLPELQRKRKSIMLYSEKEIRGINEVAGVPADIITIDGLNYEVQKVKYYKELCEHYEAVALEVNP